MLRRWGLVVLLRRRWALIVWRRLTLVLRLVLRLALRLALRLVLRLALRHLILRWLALRHLNLRWLANRVLRHVVVRVAVTLVVPVVLRDIHCSDLVFIVSRDFR